MNDKFDELTIGMAQSVTRRRALKKFGIGVAGIALAALGLGNKASANSAKHRYHCRCNDFVHYGCDTRSGSYSDCVNYCGSTPPPHGCSLSP
jgi:hypothetical protein